MQGLSLKLLSLTLLITTVGIAGTTRDEETLSKISGYRDWQRLTTNPKPIPISSFGG